MLLKSIQSILLVGTELNHVLGCVYDYYSRKPPLVGPSRRFLKCPRALSLNLTKVL
jgi:hypothetical protein